MLDSLLDLILPPVCLACDRAIATSDTARLICRRCRTLLRRIPPPWCQRCGAPRLRTGRNESLDGCTECASWPAELHSARSAFLMHPPADRVVHQLKYRGWSALADQMAQSMVQVLRDSDFDVAHSIIVPVPTTASRLRERGYNQAELIARGVAKALGQQCELLLERSTSKTTQTTLQPAARGANVAGAFRVHRDACETVQNALILIVDDVLTTGATTMECTRTLIAAGARATAVLTYARAFDTRRLLGT